MRPEYAIGLVFGGIAAFLAWQSPAYPIALVSLPSIAFAILGPDPLPKGVVTLGMSAWAGLALFFALVRGKRNPPLRTVLSLPVIASLVLVGVMIVRLGASAAPDYGAQKTELFLAGNVVLVIAGIFVGWRPEYFKVFMRLTLIVAMASAVVLVAKFVGGSAKSVLPSRFAISAEEDPISLGRHSADGVLIAMYLALSAGRVLRLWAAACLPVLGVALLGAGSRGPVVGLACGVFVLLALAASNRRTRRRLVLVGVGILVAVMVVPELVPNSTISRSLSILTGSGSGDAGLSSNGRAELWSAAYSAFAAHPLIGIGTGAFASITTTSQLYPHNLFLEAAVEFGLVGLVLVALFVGDVAARLIRSWRSAAESDRPAVSIVIALLVAAMVNAFFSGALPNNSAVWLWAGVATGLAARILGERRFAGGRVGPVPGAFTPEPQRRPGSPRP
jgi:O-antigen ligase